MALTGHWLLVVLGLAAAGLALPVARPHPLHARWARLLSGALAAVVLTAGAAAWTNDRYGLYRSWRDLLGVHSRDLVAVHPAGRAPGAVASAIAALPARIGDRHGTLLSLTIPGPASGVAPRAAFVYLPPQYRDPAYAATRFPVVEAFQGSPGRPSDWILGLHLDFELDTAIASGAVRPAIVVVPDTNAGLARSLECANTRDGKNDETFLVNDVRTWMDRTFRVLPGRWTAIGYSTGGYCALDLAMRHPSAYAAAVSLDGYAHALADRYARGIWRDRADRLAHSPDWWVRTHPAEHVGLYLLAGRDDQDSRRDALRFWSLLLRTGWWRPYDALVLQPRGRHTFPAWEAALVPALHWALPGRPQPPPKAGPHVLRAAGAHAAGTAHPVGSSRR